MKQTGQESGERLAAVRAELTRLGVDGFLVPRADDHLGEYVPANAERLAWLTGFTGSAGLAIVLVDVAAVFTDGRYTVQLEQQTDPALWERRHSQTEPSPAWLAKHVPPGGRIGYDPWLISEDALARYRDAGVALVPLDRNPVDEVWSDRPPPPRAPARPHPLVFAGRPSGEKREEIAAILRAAKTQAAIITDTASIAWLLNIRGSDIPYTPTALAFAVIDDTGATQLFIDPAKVTDELRDWLGNAVQIEDHSALAPSLARLAGKRVRVDSEGSPAWFAQTLRAAGAEVVAGSDPCALPKACKSAVERDGIRAAHRRDAVAVCRFLYWLETEGEGETELSAAAHLLAVRAEDPDFRGESFPAIVGAGEHGAIIHYRAMPDTNRTIFPRELVLIDSGAQYQDGTTDITRTVWIGSSAPPPPQLCDQVTRVLRGHIAIASAAFPKGVAGPHLDAFARRALWDVGLDYDHGTGHGVGAFLSVHEGPAGLSRTARPVALAEGMVLSDEPGFYAPGSHGIRLENLLLVVRSEIGVGGRDFLAFETLSLAPFDRRLILADQLTADERSWLDAYHARVLREVGPALPSDVAAWLVDACRPL